MYLGKNSISTLLKFCGEYLEASEPDTVLRIQIDNKLNFENPIKYLCSKASKKIGALQRISNLLDTQKKIFCSILIIKSQFNYCQFQFNYCQFVWRF